MIEALLGSWAAGHVASLAGTIALRRLNTWRKRRSEQADAGRIASTLQWLQDNDPAALEAAVKKPASAAKKKGNQHAKNS